MHGNVKKYGFIFHHIEMITIKAKKYIIVKNVKNTCTGTCYAGPDLFPLALALQHQLIVPGFKDTDPILLLTQESLELLSFPDLTVQGILHIRHFHVFVFNLFHQC